MVRVDAERVREYRDAWEAWQKQLGRLHEVFLEGDAIEPPQLKGLLNREARAKERYDAAREALLGVGPASSRIGAPAGRPMGRTTGSPIRRGAIGRPDAPGIDSE